MPSSPRLRPEKSVPSRPWSRKRFGPGGRSGRCYISTRSRIKTACRYRHGEPALLYEEVDWKVVHKKNGGHRQVIRSESVPGSGSIGGHERRYDGKRPPMQQKIFVVAHSRPGCKYDRRIAGLQKSLYLIRQIMITQNTHSIKPLIGCYSSHNPACHYSIIPKNKQTAIGIRV